MKRTAAILALALLAAPAVAPAISLQDSFTQTMERGLSLYEQGEYTAARRAFQDARLLRPESNEARMNLGLAFSREGDVRSARGVFEELTRSASASDELRAQALYNLGTLALLEAEIILDDPSGDVTDAIPPLLDSIMRFNRALEINPDYESARFNRAQAQHFLQEISELIPPPMDAEQEFEQESDPDAEPEEGEDEQEQESSGEEEGEDESDQQPGDEGEEEESDQQQGESDSQEGDDSEDQRQQGEMPPDDQEDQSEADADESEGQPEGDGEAGEDERDMEGAMSDPPVDFEEEDGLTEEEANALLNLLGDDNLLPLGRSSRTELDRNW